MWVLVGGRYESLYSSLLRTQKLEDKGESIVDHFESTRVVVEDPGSGRFKLPEELRWVGEP